MASNPPPRYVVLDDTDSSISYEGPGWFLDSGSKDNIGNFGPPYLHTLHGTSVNGTVSFQFQGTAIRVRGTNSVKDSQTNPDPNFECFVDDVSIGREPPFFADENNWSLCQTDKLKDGSHKLRMDIKVASKNQTFWLDQIQYMPSKDMPLDNTTILFENTDPAIRYDAQWGPLGGGANMTTHTNSTVLVDFVGVSVSWVAFIPTELPHTGTTGTYSIDNGKPATFLLKGLPQDSKITIYNQFFFTTPPVDPGPHTLAVTFLGSGQTTPLAVDYLYIQNGTFPTPKRGGNGNPNRAPGPKANGKSSSSPPIGAILGGVLGALALLIILAGLFLFLRRRQARKAKAKPISTIDTIHSPTPFDPFDPYSNRYGPNHMTEAQRHHFNGSAGEPAEVTPLVLTLPQQQESSAVRKQREAFGNTRRTPTTPHQSTPGGSSRGSSETSWVPSRSTVQHEDSGIRLREPIVDVPPHYTAD